MLKQRKHEFERFRLEKNANHKSDGPCYCYACYASAFARATELSREDGNRIRHMVVSRLPKPHFIECWRHNPECIFFAGANPICPTYCSHFGEKEAQDTVVTPPPIVLAPLMNDEIMVVHQRDVAHIFTATPDFPQNFLTLVGRQACQNVEEVCVEQGPMAMEDEEACDATLGGEVESLGGCQQRPEIVAQLSALAPYVEDGKLYDATPNNQVEGLGDRDCSEQGLEVSMRLIPHVHKIAKKDAVDVVFDTAFFKYANLLVTRLNATIYSVLYDVFVHKLARIECDFRGSVDCLHFTRCDCRVHLVVGHPYLYEGNLYLYGKRQSMIELLADIVYRYGDDEYDLVESTLRLALREQEEESVGNGVLC